MNGNIPGGWGRGERRQQQEFGKAETQAVESNSNSVSRGVGLLNWTLGSQTGKNARFSQVACVPKRDGPDITAGGATLHSSPRHQIQRLPSPNPHVSSTTLLCLLFQAAPCGISPVALERQPEPLSSKHV